MDTGGGMSQVAADSLYQSQMVVADFPASNGSILNAGDQNGKDLLLTISPAGNLATLTIAFPLNPKLGQQFDISIPQFAIAALTLSASGGAIINAPTALTAGAYVSFRYVKTNFWARAN